MVYHDIVYRDTPLLLLGCVCTMNKFIGREKELKKFNKMYESDKLEVAVVYGRRRVGKTTLINRFCEKKDNVFFAAQENNFYNNLQSLSEVIFQFEADRKTSGAIFNSFEAAFDRLADLAKDRRLIFVIDEYPYLAKSYPAVSSILQNYIDHQFQNTRLMIILCGSSMSFMEHQVLGYESPLYGRRTAQFKIVPFDYYDTAKWFPSYSNEDKALMYGITGGIPMYLRRFSDKKTIKENLLDELFDENAILFDEPANLLKQELREPSTYNSIIQSIANGSTKISEISSKAGIETGTCMKYIFNLIELGIVKRETPVTDENSKRPIYLLEDMFFDFWYTFVVPNRSAIISGRIESFYDEVIGKRLADYMGKVFERMCKEYIATYDDALPFSYGRIGQWWGGNPKTKKQAQIDVVAVSSDEKSVIVGSCNYMNKKVGLDEYGLMLEYGDILSNYQSKHIYLFSKSGFDDKLSKEKDVRLITLDEMYK